MARRVRKRRRPQSVAAERADRLCACLNLAYELADSEAEWRGAEGYTGRVILSEAAVGQVLADRARVAMLEAQLQGLTATADAVDQATYDERRPAQTARQSVQRTWIAGGPRAHQSPRSLARVLRLTGGSDGSPPR